MENFIETYQMKKDICNDIIDFFVKSEYKGIGTVGHHEVIPKIKNSLDLSISEKCFDYPFDEYRKHLQDCLNQYIKKYSHLNDYAAFNVNSPYNIQFYPPKGGFHVFHNERQEPLHSDRVLVFMTYLNDVENGGTEFKYQNLITPAKKGTTLIWPTDFTHIHRGQISDTNIKYIVTGWFSFNNNL